MMKQFGLSALGSLSSLDLAVSPAIRGLYQVGGPGADSLYGSIGDDTMIGWGGNDWIIGWAGNDQVLGGDGADLIYGMDDADTLFGWNGQDVIYGGLGDDELYGEAHRDRLLGEEGDDTLWGGTGDDILNGGIGADILFGGAGADRFAFINLNEVGLAPGTRDVVMDFEDGIDKIDLGGIDADSVHSGNNVFRLSQTALHDGLPGSLRLVVVNGDTYVMADRDGDRISDFSIQIEGIHQLTASDFYL
jgi:Ca2+-binding RTX toxin-like protein